MDAVTMAYQQRTLQEKASFVLDALRAMGINPNPASPLKKIGRVLSVGFVSQDDPNFEIALESLRDLHHLEFIFDHIDVDTGDDALVRMAKTLVKDSALPQHDQAQTKGRDMQFQLFVSALCHASGLRPVLHEEPDVTCVVERIKFGIAAKRVKRLGSLEARIREAANQIEAAELPGIIALDTTLLLNPENARASVPCSDVQFGRSYRIAINEFVHDRHAQMQDWVRGKGVRGIIVHDHIVRFDRRTGWSLAGMSFRVCTALHNQRRSREFAMFASAYLEGLPSLGLA